MRNVQPHMIGGIDHVGLSVSSLDRALAFYRDVLGMQVVAEGVLDERYDAITDLTGVRCKGVMLRIGTLQIELFEFANPRPKPGDRDRPVCDHGITHIAIQVTDIEQVYKRLTAAGVTFHCPPQKFSSGNKATYGRDPDGNVFELLERPM
jgi:catechol 2,3-dioxygenase-like lactoylglutathione lyase family enzyme